MAEQSRNAQTLQYRYDASNRLVQIGNGSNTIASYQIDARGRRISKTLGSATVSTNTIWYLYADEGLIAELDSQGRITKAYGWLPDSGYGTAPLWMAETDNTHRLSTATFHFLHTDHLGTPQIATDAQGNRTWKGRSEAFGQTTPDNANQIVMNLRFPGQYFDSESQTHYNYFRDYDPGVGRYLQSDPIGLEGDINLYGYVDANSNIYIDPYGLAISGMIKGISVDNIRLRNLTFKLNESPPNDGDLKVTIFYVKVLVSGDANINILCIDDDRCNPRTWEMNGKISVKDIPTSIPVKFLRLPIKEIGYLDILYKILRTDQFIRKWKSEIILSAYTLMNTPDMICKTGNFLK